MKFQLTASRGGRRESRRGRKEISNFNSRPHEEADWKLIQSKTSQELFQLTASRGGRRFKNGSFAPNKYISTHGLTRRPTIPGYINGPGLIISTHGLTRRPTRFPSPLLHLNKFQLTASRGGRRQAGRGRAGMGLISTHGLTRRPTVILLIILLKRWYFNSRPHEEADSNFK